MTKFDWSKANKRQATVYYRQSGHEEVQARKARLREEREFEEWLARKNAENKPLTEDGYDWLARELRNEADNPEKMRVLQWVKVKSKEQDWPETKVRPVTLSLYRKGFEDRPEATVVPTPSVINREPYRHPVLNGKAAKRKLREKKEAARA